MKNTNSLYKTLFLSLLCLIPFTGVRADEVIPSESTCQCKDYLGNVNVGFDIDEEGGATFEYYKNANNESEIGYRSCVDECSIVFAGKCKAPELTCDNFINDFSCNVKIGDEYVVEGPTDSCRKDVSLSCRDYIDTVNFDFKIVTEDGVTCENTSGTDVGYTVDDSQCKVTFSSKCKATGGSDEPDDPFEPEPVVSECNFYTGNITYLGYKASTSVKDPIRYDSATADLSCLTSKLNSIINVGYHGYGKCPHNQYYDDCIAIRVTDEFFGFTDDVGSENVRSNGSICKSYVYKLIHDGRWNACGEGEFYLDKNCNVIRKPENGKECGNFSVLYYKSTPISLIFEKDLNINDDMVFVNFNLDPAGQDSWYTWKASNKAPLLVYDPEHTGKVDSAYQLFGEWTFGGKQSASLPLHENFTPSSKWENGFEALASLDRDFDGMLSGDELNELALWFDGNRDAISQPGEVIPLVHTGVTTLYVNGYKKDANGDLRIDLGYERKIGDEVIQGASVDWYGKGADSKRDLVEAYSPTFLKSNFTNQEIVAQKVETSKNTGSTIDSSDFRGLWKFFIDGEEKYATPDGYLILGQGEETNSIEGYSLSERIVNKSTDNKYHSHVGMFRLTGSISMSDKNEKVISFSIPRDNLVNKSTARLSSDKNNMIGKTTIILDGGVRVATYSWRAVRNEIE